MSGNARDDLPRVSIDSLHDWQRIRANFENAAYTILEERLSQSELREHRQLLHSHVKQFVHRTFEIAKPNLRINGRNFDDYREDEQDTDQFDEALDRRVWSLSDQRLKWDLEIALKRRGIPAEVAALMRDLANQQREHDATKIPRLNDEDMELESTLDEDADARTVANELIEYAAELREMLPEQLERVNRAKQVDMEIRSLRV